MRTELRIASWIVAAVALVLAVLHRPSISISGLDETERGPEVVHAVVELPPEGKDGVPLPTPTASMRPLFRLAPSEAQAETIPFAVSEPQAVPPTLRGIIDTNAGLRAVFEAFGDEPAYVVVGVEETIGTLRVTSISGDTVSAEADNGEVINFKLRGSGESLE